MGDQDSTFEKLKGSVKETAGKITGSDEMSREGQQQQRRGEKEEEADALEAKAAEKKNQAEGHEGAQRKHQ